MGDFVIAADSADDDVIKVQVVCELTHETPHQFDLELREEVLLGDGRTVSIDRGRGLSSSVGESGQDSSVAADPWFGVDVDDLEHDIRAVLGLASPGDKGFQALAERLAADGISTTAERLSAAQVRIRLAESVLRRIGRS